VAKHEQADQKAVEAPIEVSCDTNHEARWTTGRTSDAGTGGL